MDKRKLLTKNDYSKIYRLYADDYGNDNEHFDLIDKSIDIVTQRNLLKYQVIDLGTGPGNVTDYLLNKNISNIIAVDFSPEFIRFLKKKYSGNKLIHVVCSDMLEYLKQRKPSSACLITAGFSIIHVVDKEVDELFKEIHRVLVPGGLFVMSCFKGVYKGREKEPYQTQKDKRLVVEKPLELYMNYFTENELQKRTEKAKLKIVELNTYPAVTSELIDFTADKIWLLVEK